MLELEPVQRRLAPERLLKQTELNEERDACCKRVWCPVLGVMYFKGVTCGRQTPWSLGTAILLIPRYCAFTLYCLTPPRKPRALLSHGQPFFEDRFLGLSLIRPSR